MPGVMSNRVILITEKPRITTPVKIALNSLALEIEGDYPALTSLSLMRTGIAKSGKTAFIRTELLRFIKEKGYPRAIILDSQIDLGPENAKDPGMLKIFKTFLIAYIILSKGADNRNLHGNFVLLTKGNSFEKEFGIGSNPHKVTEMLTTQNPEINIFIDELKGDRQRFDSLFSIELLDTALSSDMITETVKKFITSTNHYNPKSDPAINKNGPADKTAENNNAENKNGVKPGSDT